MYSLAMILAVALCLLGVLAMVVATIFGFRQRKTHARPHDQPTVLSQAAPATVSSTIEEPRKSTPARDRLERLMNKTDEDVAKEEKRKVLSLETRRMIAKHLVEQEESSSPPQT